MKVAITADVHFGSGTSLGKIDPRTGQNSRIIDFFNTFDSTIEEICKQKVQVFILAGDAYKTNNPSNYLRQQFAERIKKLLDAGIVVFLLQGNHDISPSDQTHTSSTYQVFKVPELHVIDEPSSFEVKDELFVAAIPYIDKRILRVKKSEDLINHYKTVVNQLKLKNERKLTTLFIGHQLLEKANFPTSYTDFSYQKDVPIPTDIFESFDLSVFGHIHRGQVVSEDPLIIIPGSMDRIDISDANQDKHIVLFDTETKKIEYLSTNARKIIRIRFGEKEEIKGSDLIKAAQQELDIDNINEAIVRIEADTSDSSDKSYKDQLMNLVSSKAWFNAGVIVNVKSKDRRRDEEINETLSEIEALERYFELRGFDKKKIKDLCIKGESIMQECTIG